MKEEFDYTAWYRIDPVLLNHLSAVSQAKVLPYMKYRFKVGLYHGGEVLLPFNPFNPFSYEITDISTAWLLKLDGLSSTVTPEENAFWEMMGIYEFVCGELNQDA